MKGNFCLTYHVEFIFICVEEGKYLFKQLIVQKNAEKNMLMKIKNMFIYIYVFIP